MSSAKLPKRILSLQVSVATSTATLAESSECAPSVYKISAWALDVDDVLQKRARRELKRINSLRPLLRGQRQTRRRQRSRK